jgi:ComF family protein
MAKVDDWLAWLIPPRCVLCNEPSGALPVCDGCRDDLPWLTRRCVACTAELPKGAGSACGRCGVLQPAPTARAAFSYEYPVDRMITAAKFRGELHHARALGALLATTCPADFAADLLVPVPLHRERLLERGYNQALEIARPIVERTGIPLAAALCERIRPTREQSGLPASERRRNLRGAFAVRGRCAGARLVIIDDVITTGSTAAALARVLRSAGAEVAAVWAVAQALQRVGTAAT